jgi:signal transduction histidine kinase
MLCNRLCIVMAIFILLLTSLQIIYFNAGIVSIMGLVCAGITSFPILLNAKGYIQISRLLLCILLPVAPMAISIYTKSNYRITIGESLYYDYRYILLGVSIIPPMIFSLNEKKPLLFCLALVLACFIFFDPIHELFQVGYFDIPHSTKSYRFSGTLAVLICLIIMGCTFVLKNIYEGFEIKNEDLIEELTIQADRINESQKKLQEANRIIRDQKELLEKENQNLESELVDKNKSLIDANAELIKHNNELIQFSYTVSHNLRGPVASLMGLVQLVDLTTLDTGNKEILGHATKAIERLDITIRDLAKIIDIRNDIFRIRQRINIKEEFEQLKSTFEREIKAHHITILDNFSSAPFLYSVRPMVTSILYNLISNSIKYRSNERDLSIEVSSLQNDTDFFLKIIDNGMGIDLNFHKDNLFKLYKRFHQHIEGKGLGLYLVKLQAEALKGDVEVKSEINQFTEFTIRIAKPQDIERQVFYAESHAQIFYDATLNCTGIIWKGPLSGEQYRNVFLKCLECVKVYHSPNYLTDLTNQGSVNREDQQWMFNEIIPEAAKNGLIRIAIVRSDSKEKLIGEYMQGISGTVRNMGINQQFFVNRTEACEWIQNENEKAALK